MDEVVTKDRVGQRVWYVAFQIADLRMRMPQAQQAKRLNPMVRTAARWQLECFGTGDGRVIIAKLMERQGSSQG